MQHVSIPRFVLVHALISAMVSLGFPSLSCASPMPQPLDPPPPWIDQQSDILTLEDVLVNPEVTETSAAEVLSSLGVMVSPDANVALVADSNVVTAGQFTICVNSEPTDDTVIVMARTQAALTMVQQEIMGTDQAAVADMEATMTLASATLAYGSVSAPVLCTFVTLVTQPREAGAPAVTAVGVSLLGEAVNALTAAAFVRQISDFMTVQAMEQQGGGFTPPTPPPPTMMPCCTCECGTLLAIGTAGCATA